MKYIILLGDGMADFPVAALGGKTPLEYARTPNMDCIASEGTLGLVDTIPNGLVAGSDIANLSILGYNPVECYSGRGPLEAASMGVKMGPEDLAFRCNLITLCDEGSPRMEDFTAGHIKTDVAAVLIDDLNKEIGSRDFTFYPGVSYRHLLLWKDCPNSIRTTPPHDIIGREIEEFLPDGAGVQLLRNLMLGARGILQDHPVNRKRIREKEKPANAVWFWGEGRVPSMPLFTSKFNLTGGMISAVDLLKGIGLYAGLQVIHVDGATGYIDTNYRGKAEKALEFLEILDFIFLHVEAPDEMGHEGNLQGKIKAIEDFDSQIVGRILDGMPKFGIYRIMVLSDHPTPLSMMTHSSDPSPFAVLSSEPEENIRRKRYFTEASAKESQILISPGFRLIDLFIRDWRKFVRNKHH